MKKTIFYVLFVMTAIATNAQKRSIFKKEINPYSTIDKTALELPETQATTIRGIANYFNANFNTDSEKVRATFIWTASNIEYDVDNMFAINFYETTENKIEKALKTKKGICENYAAVFNAICLSCGIKSYTIIGYTKQNGSVNYVPHAWNAALVNNSWYLFDPTWGAGFINNGKFEKKIQNTYFKIRPLQIIKTHIPFDPIWEFLNYPVTNKEFYEGKTTENKSKPYFSYIDSIAIYEKQSEIEQYEATSRRIEHNGVKNSLIYDILRHYKLAIENYNKQKEQNSNNEMVALYNNALAEYNTGINNFNAFVRYKNSQFKPIKSDEEIQAMFDAGNDKIKSAKTKLIQIKKPDANMAQMIIASIKGIDDILPIVDEQKEWLFKYFSKSKLGRQAMFTKKW